MLHISRARQAFLQDLGRPGLERLGIAVNGASDQYSARVANTLVGNAVTAPLVEITAGELAFTADRPVLLAVTGAEAAVTVAGRPRPQWQAVSVDAHETVSIRDLRGGLRSYLALHGALDAPLWAGSCAPDSLLQIGTRLEREATIELVSDFAGVEHPTFGMPLFQLDVARPAFARGAWTIDVTPGIHADEFRSPMADLCAGTYVVQSESNHVGLRLDGAPPERSAATEVLSKGVPVGALEVPGPTDDLILLLRGRLVTAGYPVIAVATTTAQSLLGQARPGQALRFRERAIEQATHAIRAQRAYLDSLAQRIATVFGELGISCRAT